VFLERGADPNGGDGGFSALHAAVLRGNVDIVNLLLAAKADVNARVIHGEPVRKYGQEYAITASWKGATPLWLAARFGEPAIIRALMKAGADITIASDDGTSPIFATIPAGGLVVATGANGTTQTSRPRPRAPRRGTRHARVHQGPSSKAA